MGYQAPKIEINTKEDRLLKEQTDNFEAFFVKQVLDIALKDKSTLYPKDPGDKIYQSMYNDTMSQEFSGSFGFSELLFNFLKENAK
ncbi:MAG: rod-binding protein [Sulfurospirillaceae bacterium]|nr:rod-binding protein [Sulfurospirillaceae bacterium]